LAGGDDGSLAAESFNFAISLSLFAKKEQSPRAKRRAQCDILLVLLKFPDINSAFSEHDSCHQYRPIFMSEKTIGCQVVRNLSPFLTGKKCLGLRIFCPRSRNNGVCNIRNPWRYARVILLTKGRQ